MSNKKILIIGDKVAVDNVLRSILTDEIECMIDIYYLTADFLNYILKYDPALIIATSGHQESIIQEIKRDKKLKTIPIFLLSGYYDQEDIWASVADEFQSKPVEIPIFLETVKKYIN